MYSPTTRLLSVLELLQSRRQISGSEIAARLEVDPRTVRRYIVMLQDMGIPVEAARGPYGSYQLRRGHRIPPLLFTEAEAVALTLGLLAIRALRFPASVEAVESALAKTERVLPEKLLGQARALQESITFHLDFMPQRVESRFVSMLSSAVQQGRRVHMRYRAWDDTETERDFDPYGIVFREGFWYTAGHCHLRGGQRTFRLDRIAALDWSEGSFERPEHFDVLDQVLRSLYEREGIEEVRVLMQTTLEHARQVTSPDLGTLEETRQGVLFRRAAIHLDWVAFFLMGLDFPVVVLEPEALRTTLREMAEKALRMLGEQA